MVAFAPYNENLPKDVVALAEYARLGITLGKIHPFTGPINKQDGTPWLAEGETAPIGDLLGMNFYVEGVDGALPK